MTDWKNTPGDWWASETFKAKDMTIDQLEGLLEKAVNEGGMARDSRWGTEVNKEVEPWDIKLLVFRIGGEA